MRDINAILLGAATQTAGFTGTPYQMAKGTPYEGMPVCVRIDDAVAPTSGPITLSLVLQESDNPTAGYSSVLTYVFSIGPTATAGEITKRYASQKPYVRAVGQLSGAAPNLVLPIQVAVVTGDIT